MFLPQKDLLNLINLFKEVFCTGGNIIFFDHKNNFNYLPVKKLFLKKRSTKQISHFIKYFNVRVLIFFNVKWFFYLYKIFLKKKYINILFTNNKINYSDTHINIFKKPINFFLLKHLFFKLILVFNKKHTI